MQALLLGLEFGGDSHPLREYVLQLRGRRGFRAARLFHVPLKLLLPLFCTAVRGEQLSERVLAGLLLLGPQRIELLLGGLQLLHTGLLAILFLLQVLLTLLLFGQLFLLLIELRQALGDLPIKLHEDHRRLRSQRLQGFGRQQAGERAEFFVQALAVIAQFALLIVQMPGPLAGARSGRGAIAGPDARRPVAG